MDNAPVVPALFDANGSFGEPAAGGSDCPDLAARLAHMDRLGIARSLVWNAEAVQDYSLGCNRRLLDAIAATPGAARRIIPALVVSGLIAYEPDGIARLRRQMQERGTRALRFVSVFGRLTLAQCDPVLHAILDLKPFLLLKVTETDPQDILAFTEMFPEVPVVLTDVMWGQGIVALDLMRRRPNILLETSWWHTWDGVRMVVQQFGAERVLFGTGYRSHNGAAVAALARADITDEQRALIAHGTLDGLTGSAMRDATPEPTVTNRLWERFLAGTPLGVDVVDSHGHLGGSAGYVVREQEVADQVPVVLRAMDRVGQQTMIVSGLQALLGSPLEGHRRLHELLKPHADRFLVYFAFNPHYAAELVPRFDAWFADPQLAGFKLLCGYWKVKVTDPRFAPMWEYANRRRLPVLVHSWTGGADAPAMARDIAAQYPDLALLLGHSGGTDEGRLEAEELAAEFPNVFLEWCGSFCSMRPWEETLTVVPPEQVVHGTDAAVHGIDWELGRLLSLDVPEETLELILGRNMRRILAKRR